MLLPSSSAPTFRPLLRLFSPFNYPALARHASRHFACSKRVLSADATNAKQEDVTQWELAEDRETTPDPLFSVMKQKMGELRNSRSDSLEDKAESSHFTEMKKEASAFKLARPKHLPVPKKNVLPVKKHRLSKGKTKEEPSAYIFCSSKLVAPTDGTPTSIGAPGAGKTSRRRLKRDLKTVSELIHGASGNFDSSLKLESWKDDWGEDNLKPSSTESRSLESYSERLPSYIRRIEGLIGHSDKDVLEEVEPPTGRVAIATLAHGLDRVLFNPGVHWVQDPRSRVYNFTPHIQTVPDVKDFAFERLNPFIRSSRDTVMQNLAIAKGRRFAGSTSSLTGLLCQIYFLLSQDRKVDLSTLPEPFSSARRNFTPAQRMPTAVVFNHKDGVYMIDSDSTDNDDGQWNVLMWIGTVLESFFTLPRSEFAKLIRSANPENVFKNQPQAYRYSQSKLFVMRSQLDCVDPRLPGSGIFDIKTRAALPLRLDNLNFKENSGYLIDSLHGPLNSIDREYYDLIRSAFLKYSFQARIGNMDGIFLAYHNTARIFGFQYVPLEEMDERLFGVYRFKRTRKKEDVAEAGGKVIGWRIFNKCIAMLEVIASEITECFPGKTVTCLAETRPGTGIMHVWIQPVDEAFQAESEDEIPIVEADPEKPIIQLDITARSFLGGLRAVRPDAIFLSRKPWTVHWSISRSSLPEKAIRQHLAAATKRKYNPKAYPTGVNSNNVKEFIKNLGFGNPESCPDPKSFTKANATIMFLRKISRAGQLELERLQKQDETKGVHMLQSDDLTEPSVIPLSTNHPIPSVKENDACESSNDDLATEP